MKIFILIIAVFSFATAVYSEIPLTVIPEEVAREMAIERYNSLFDGKYYRFPNSDTYYPFSRLTPEYFDQAKVMDGIWYLSADPPKGVHLDVRVQESGKYVELIRVGVSQE